MTYSVIIALNLACDIFLHVWMNIRANRGEVEDAAKYTMAWLHYKYTQSNLIPK